MESGLSHLAPLVGWAKRLARAVCDGWRRLRARCDARRAFRYDRARFLAHAGALHRGRLAAARAEIVMGYHVLEKGLTMPRRRYGFGREAARRLAGQVAAFERRFGRDPQVDHAVGVLKTYRDLHKNIPLPDIDRLLAARPDAAAAVEPHLTRAAFFAAKDAPFPVFAASRHVVRHFAGPVPRETIEAAVALAETAPSACNRRPARVHAVDDPALRDRILALQGGARGFGADADKLLLVTVDLSTVRWAWERHDGWTNGGIFLMNLCYALHWHGVAHCLLHWSVPPRVDRAVRALLGLPGEEEIVAVLACGAPPDEFDIAASPRTASDRAVAWHGGGTDEVRR